MKVHIVGRGEGWQDAPALSPEYEVWGLNNVIVNRDLDVAIDIHPGLDGNLNDHKRTLSPQEVERIVEKIKESKVPFYTYKKWDHVPCIEYPLREIIATFGSDYFGGGLDYCIALALYLGKTDIHLWGFNFLGGFDYTMQLPSASYWIGFARGYLRPVNGWVTVHGEKRLLLKTKTEKLYGFDITQCLN